MAVGIMDWGEWQWELWTEETDNRTGCFVPFLDYFKKSCFFLFNLTILSQQLQSKGEMTEKINLKEYEISQYVPVLRNYPKLACRTWETPENISLN